MSSFHDPLIELQLHPASFPARLFLEFPYRGADRGHKSSPEGFTLRMVSWEAKEAWKKEEKGEERGRGQSMKPNSRLPRPFDRSFLRLARKAWGTKIALVGS